MTKQHPNTPLPELVQQWANSSPIQHSDESWAYELFIAHQAARWSADQELEACCKDIIEIIAGVFADRVIDDWDQFVELLRDGRRPKPPSLSSIALQMLGTIERDAHYLPEITDTIRRALEALPND